MKSIIEELEVIDPVVAIQEQEKPADSEYVMLAKELGFQVVAGEKSENTPRPLPYPEITDEAIHKFLSKRIDEMLRSEVGTNHGGYRSPKGQYTPVANYEVYGAYPRVKWLETPIEEYKGLPPRHVLTALQRAKESRIFERFAIVTVEEVVDPLLIGITSEGRMGLIDHWSIDISMDEILDLTSPSPR